MLLRDNYSTITLTKVSTGRPNRNIGIHSWECNNILKAKNLKTGINPYS